jgi:hypothetical protein
MQEAFKHLRPDWLAHAVPGLHIGALARPAGPPPASEPSFSSALASRGWAALPHLASDESARSLATTIDRLIADGLPPVAAYGFDETWMLGLEVRDRVARALGHEYALVEDVWAFLVRPGASGWPPHRGVSAHVLDRQCPEYLNVWIALSDAPSDRSCMHFLPLDVDARYPAELEVEPEATAGGAPAPVSAGTALVWNANTLHWGGPCARDAAGPRVSCTFSLCRRDAAALPALGPVHELDERSLTPWERIDIIARQIEIYGANEVDVSDAVRAWAKTTAALSRRMAPPP